MRALIRFTLTVVITATLTATVFWLYFPASAARYTEQKTTLSILQNETLTFLVTRRVVTQVVVEHEEGDWIGDWRAVLWGTVRICYGMDLDKITPDDIRREGDVLVVRLPEPEMLDFALEPGSVGFLSKSTAAAKIQDMLHNGQRRKLEQALRQAALDFVAQQDMLPSREQLVRQLNDAIAAFNSPDLKLRFE